MNNERKAHLNLKQEFVANALYAVGTLMGLSSLYSAAQIYTLRAEGKVVAIVGVAPSDLNKVLEETYNENKQTQRGFLVIETATLMGGMLAILKATEMDLQSIGK